MQESDRTVLNSRTMQLQIEMVISCLNLYRKTILSSQIVHFKRRKVNCGHANYQVVRPKRLSSEVEVIHVVTRRLHIRNSGFSPMASPSVDGPSGHAG